MSTALAQAVAAARQQDHAAARDALILAWRLRRAPVLAELVAVLAARAPDPLTTALAELVTPRVATTLAHLRALQPIDDPRLAAFAAAALAHPPFTSPAAKELLHAIVLTAERHGDPRLVAAAPAITAALTTRILDAPMRDGLVASVRRVVAALPRVAPATAAERELEAELTRLVEPMRATARSAAALLAEIYASPEDDAPRLVYADLLTAQGDPRGELIVLQIARARADVAEPGAREAKLLEAHGPAWLGDLAPVLAWGRQAARTRFRRGFLAEADVTEGVAAELHQLREHPAWATVEAFADVAPDTLIAAAPLPALRAIRFAGERLPARPAGPLAAVTSARVYVPPPRAELAALLPNLVTLIAACHIDPAAIAAFTACGAPHVDLWHLYTRDEPREVARARFGATLAALIGAPAPVELLTLRPPYADVRPPPIALRRGGDGRWERA